MIARIWTAILNAKYQIEFILKATVCIATKLLKVHCVWVRGHPMGHKGKMPADTISNRAQISMHRGQAYVPQNSYAVLLQLGGNDNMTPIPYKKTDGDWRLKNWTVDFICLATLYQIQRKKDEE